MKLAPNYLGSLLAQLPRGSSVEHSGAGTEMHVACKHDHTEMVSLGKRFPPDSIRRILANKGWQFNGNRATCPAHADLKVKGQNLTQISEAMKAAQATKVADTKVVPIAPSLSAKHARRDALRWLDETFDISAGRYKDGMSDEKIAAEVSLSAKAIADLRAEFGYDLKTPPEILEWMERLKEIRETIVGLQSDVSRLQSEAATIVQNVNARVDRLEARIERYQVNG